MLIENKRGRVVLELTMLEASNLQQWFLRKDVSDLVTKKQTCVPNGVTGIKNTFLNHVHWLFK